jgi:hypothetical protein
MYRPFIQFKTKSNYKAWRLRRRKHQSTGTKMLAAITAALMAFTVPVLVQAQQASPQDEQRAAPQETSTPKKSIAIDVAIETFRKQIVPGTRMGVTADITNKSSAAIYLRQRDVQLVLPAEVDIRGIGSTEGWFPTEYEDPRTFPPDRNISLRPNETYRVFFDRPGESSTIRSNESSKLFAVRQWLQFINFTPGTYPITVEAKYWEHNKFERNDYHTAVETKTLEFVAPQSIILVGAALGGFIFALISLVRSEQSSVHGRLAKAKAGTKIIGTFVGSIFLSVIVTILFSRIAETQFVIKVTVSDFWGAIAVGFLANYGGWALLDKMVPHPSAHRTH